MKISEYCLLLSFSSKNYNSTASKNRRMVVPGSRRSSWNFRFLHKIRLPPLKIIFLLSTCCCRYPEHTYRLGRRIPYLFHRSNDPKIVSPFRHSSASKFLAKNYSEDDYTASCFCGTMTSSWTWWDTLNQWNRPLPFSLNQLSPFIHRIFWEIFPVKIFVAFLLYVALRWHLVLQP